MSSVTRISVKTRIIGAAALILVMIAGAPVWLQMLPHEDLSSSHAEFASNCLACHTPLRGVPDGKCRACHGAADFASAAVAEFHGRPGFERCVNCHSEHLGADLSIVSAFEHATLTGSATACTECHTGPSDPIHDGIRADCGACHQTDAWEPALFDHQSLAAGASCLECHSGPADTLHANLSADCGDCHEREAWTPATFDHDAYFRFDRHHPADCGDCHEGESYATFTCYGCHSERGVRREHIEEGIRDYAACEDCHRSGDEDEAKRRMRSNGGGGWGKGRHDDDDDD